MRLGLKIKGEFLNLNSGTSIPIDMQSPLYFGGRSPDVLPGTLIYNFLIPSTLPNLRILNRPQILDNYDSFFIKEPGEIYYDGELFASGTYTIKKAPAEGDITVNFIGGLSGNLKDFKTKNLSEIDLGGDRFLGPNDSSILTVANDTIANPDDYDYLFGTIKIETDDSLELRYVNNYYNNTFFRTGNDQDGVAKSTLIPFPKAKYVLQQIFQDAGYNLDNFMDLIGYEEFNNLLVFNNYSLDRIETVSDPIVLTDLRLKSTFNLQNHVPELKINQFIKDILLPFGGVALIDQKEKKVHLTNYNFILKNSDIQDWTDKVFNEFTKEEKYINIPVGLKYNHTTIDGITESYDIDLTGANILDPVEKTTDLTTADALYDIRLIHSLNQYFYNANTGSVVWRFFAKKLNEYEVGEDPINLSSDTLFMEKAFTSLLGTFDIFTPVFISKYISPINPGTEKINKTILAFHRGLDQRSNGQDYPFISNNVYNRSQTKIANFSLLVDGEYGLYNTWWKNWLEMLHRSTPVTFYARLTSKDLRLFDFSKKIKIGDHQYFVRRIQTTITTQEVKVSKLELIKIT